MKRFFFSALILFLIILACTVYYFYKQGSIWFVYPDLLKYSVHGIDISHHQGNIHWKNVKARNIQFVLIKATEGSDFKDPLFEKNWHNARHHELVRGAYHFFSFCTSGRIQALHYIATVPATAGDLPPIIDLEWGGKCARGISKTQFQNELKTFYQLVRKKYRKQPIFYSTGKFISFYLKDFPLPYTLWLRSIFREPDPTKYDWTFWQYHSKGHIKGIYGPIDFNVYRYNMQDLWLLAGSVLPPLE